MNIKCPKCATLLSLAAAPTGGKIKCPKCATILSVGGGAKAAAPAPKPNTPNPQTAAPHPTPAPNPAAAFPAAAAGGLGGLPPAGGEAPVREFYQPTTGSVYVPPANPNPEPEETGPDQPVVKKGDGSDYKMSKAGMIALAGGVGSLVFLLLAIIVGILVFGSGGSDEIASAPPLESSFEVPPGFTAFSTAGVSIAMPNGEEVAPYLGGMTSQAVRTPKNTVFFMGASSGDKVRTTDDSIKKLARKYLGGGVVLAGVCRRNGYEGKKGVMDQSIYYPDMNIEIYQVDGRFVILGVSKEGGGGGNVVVGQVSEPEMQKGFFDSFTVGPETGSFW